MAFIVECLYVVFSTVFFSLSLSLSSSLYLLDENETIDFSRNKLKIRFVISRRSVFAIDDQRFRTESKIENKIIQANRTN